MKKIDELLAFDKEMACEGFVIGTDEAGRGPGAGPVFAAAVCFRDVPEGLADELTLLNDSKKISEKRREELFEVIKKYAIYSIQQASVAEIDKKNILNASLDSMKRACMDVTRQLQTEKVKVLVDGNKLIKNYDVNQTFVIKGDSRSASIAAASILAKVSRDRLMCELDKLFPEYGWAKNKGYLTAEHVEAIKKIGTTVWHRKKFLRNIIGDTEKQLSLL